MEKIKCEIYQDLLISYCDGLTGENIAEMIREHLVECPECKCRHEEILRQREQEEQQEFSRGKEFSRKLTGLRHYMIGVVLGIMTPLLFLVLWFLYGSVRSYIQTMFYSFYL